MWEAANAPSVLPRDEGSGEILRHQNQHHNKQQISNERRIISSETIEAALSRLSKAYTTSMECIGAIHNTNRMILKEEQTSTRTATIDSALATIHTVSKVARTTLETAILLDPLVVTHDPTLHQTMIDLSNNTDNNRYDFVQEEKPTPPTISSTAHKSTLVKLAYLSLVNYSDLLLQASSVATPMKNGSILDRGIVKPLRIATTSNSDDYPPETHRLAVAALIDAVNLDPTDPITWLKLACASRKLEHVSENLTTVQKSHHRRLQRNALERGSVCLAEHLPPNRTILRALKELNRERESDKYISTNPKATTMITTKTVELTRYSWAILGKMILRACKGDEGSAPWEVKAQNTNSKALFGSPTVSIQLSPMLVLPSRVLGKICQFLENTDIWKFEATCKALSVNIIAARASMEENDESDHHESDHDDDDDDDAADLLLQRQEQRQRELLSKIQNSTPSEADSENPVNEEGPSEAQKSEEKQSEETPTSNNDNNNSNNNDNTTTSSRAPPVPARQSSRSSKRVRMKEISTSKKQDREAKRNSFHYCFLAATLSCTKEKHNDMAEDLLDTKELEHLFRGKEDKSLVSGNGGRKKGSNLQQLSMDSTQNSMEAVERISEASLSSFVQKWSSKNSGPMELLERYLGHVAMFAEEVFGSDSPTMGLHSCLLNSFQALLLRSGSLSSSIVPRFFRPLTETKSLTRTLELFAMDLIHAELIFRQCDRYTPKVVEFDDDANMISLMIPALVECCNEVKRDINAQQNENVELSTKFHFLRVRCYWLTASYYLWRSRIAQAIYLSREAEDEGIHFIGMTIDCFDSPVLISVKSVKIPHLVSPGRQDPYWREISPTSLSKFRDDIQASSVVSHARQRFQELVSNLKAESPEEEVSTQISTNDARVLVEIGKKLFDRYDSQYGSKNSKLSELVDNFLEMRGGDIVFRGDTPKDSKLSDEVMMQREPYKVEDLQRVSNPTILSMLVICLNMDEKNRLCIAKLLVRLVLTAVDMHTSLLKQIADFRLSRKQTDGYHSDDAMSDSDDDMSDIGPSSTQKDNDEKKVRQCGHFLKFLIRCLCDAVSSHLSGDEKSKLLISDEFSDMMNSVLDFSNRWYQFTVNYLSIPNDSVDRDLVRLVENILIKSKTVKDGQKVHKKLESICFRGLVQIMVSQQEVLKGLVTAQVDRSRRSARQRLCINRAEYIGLVASKMGLTLSQNLASVDNFDMSKGRLFEGHGIREENDHVSKPLTHQEEIIFLRSVRWLRKYAFQDDGESLSSSQANVVNAFDRPITKELKIPISTLIIGICGSASCSRQRGDPEASGEQDNLSLTEFFDSDASMNDWRSDSEEHGTSEKSKKELVRVICHAVHCIALVFEMVDEKDTVNRFLEIYCDAEFGPLLPLVSARVLNFFADTLLIHFGEDDVEGNDRGNLWSEGYPSHTKYTGAVLDTSLHKTYRWLYGFALVGEQNYQSTAGSEMAHTMNDISEIAEKGFKLESTAASGQLYRCIMRAYAGGRRTPPKHALEAVSAALPPMKESELNKALRRFAFSGNNTDLDIDSILTMSANWDSSFQILRDSIQQNKDSLDESGEASLEELEAMEVRRGLSKQLALGPLPIVTTDPKAKSDAGADDDRAQTISNEMAISKKFNAILNDLCLLDSDNWEGWYRASQCCVMKADTIADRLGLTLGFSRIKNFSISVDRGLSLRTLNIVDLRKEQELEERMSKKVKFLGDDYSVYMNNAWSSFSSLRDCVATMKKQYSNIDEEGIRSNNNIPLSIWNEIDSKYDKGDFLEWQEACGGVFVKALRNLSVRFMCIALYLLQSKPEITCDHKVLMSDVCETLGNIYYSELIASQNYGWPMHAMTTSRKRSLAIAAKSCYQASIKHADDSLREEDDINDHSTWDLQFMVGKCHEKIAATFDQEEFPKQTESARAYEEHMGEAISVYAKALAEATKLEEAGSSLPDQAGGSCHGSTELLYRLHASRLKCLIRAVSRNENEREQAELEALRLTEKYPFKNPDGEGNKLGSENPDVEDNAVGSDSRERLWKVFADIVNGLVECRKLKPFFHRSVFRHAQALMWSPVILDPSSSKTSKDVVPAEFGSQIQGLDCSKPAAFSAEDAMSTLFDKKRSQLCAVWVTNSGAASPFQAMNGTIRKYDSLRGKYIAAYLEALHLCNRRPEVETFLKWLYSSKRDHPSHFKAGAMNGGDKPTNSHAQDHLLLMDSSLISRGFLVSCKRQANSVLAGILMQELSNMPIGNLSKPSTDGMKVSEVYLKNAYACYLRLHCSIQDLKKLRAFKYGSDSILEVDALCQAYLSLGEAVPTGIPGSDFGDWSGGGRKLAIFKTALSKSKTLFPTLSATNFFGKSKSKKAKSSQASGPDPDENNRKSSKRKAGESDNESADNNATKRVSFEVAVPSGMKSGDTFLTSVKVGDSQTMKVKLTVPKGNHSTLRFHLNVPKSPKGSNKKAKVSSLKLS